MDYQNTLRYLYDSTPMFQQVGSKAYKEGLENTYILDEYFHHPHREFRTIHVAGTNGKGSCSHTLAAILQAAGYKVGLYTSPHLVDFRERIRIDGEKMPEEYVVRFVEENRAFFEPLQPSFFELTTAMAFRYFADRQVDVAVIETGLGGRLDCTNIIRPDVSIITNISFDHVQFLGDTLEKIAGEKAGIIKTGVPVVIGEATPETKPVFISKAAEAGAPILFAEEAAPVVSCKRLQTEEGKGRCKCGIVYQTKTYGEIEGELSGFCQEKNGNTIFTAIPLLQQAGYDIRQSHIEQGFARVCEMTGLRGRWQQLQSSPTLICDTGHNVAGIAYIVDQLAHLREQQAYRQLHIVFGMVNDKDITHVLQLLPRDATYYFTKASVKRALPEQELLKQASTAGLRGEAYPNVTDAVRAAQQKSLPEDFIFVGGSSFIVADLLTNCDALDFH